MSAFQHIIYEKDGPIAWITLNRPQVLNAVDLIMRDEMWTVLEALRYDPDVQVVIIRGAGERAFSAGADITEFGTAPSFIEARRARRERDLWGEMLALDRILIAAIHGYALGAGIEMSIYCDIRIAAEDARMGLPEVTLGYIPSAGGTQTLPRVISPGLALPLILSGDMIDAQEAYRIGLVHKVVPRERLYAEAEALARHLAGLPRSALQRAKRAIIAGLDLPLDQGFALETRLAASLAASAETRARLKAAML